MVELHPQARELLESVAARRLPPSHALSVECSRETFRERTEAMAVDEPIHDVTELAIPGPAGEIPVRIYRPAADDGLPVLLWIHGGGWVKGDLDTHDSGARALANESGCLVVSVDYRLAPEHPFPAGLEDCYAALEWLAERADVLGGDPDRIAVGGTSAGGNLTAAVSLLARDRDGPDIACQLPIYPVTDYAFDTDSYRENAEGYFLTREAMRVYWDQYLASDVDGPNPYASPLRAELEGLPPAVVLTCGFDPLRDEGDAYAARLRGADVPVTHLQYEDMIHGFLLFRAAIDRADEAIAEIGSELRSFV